MFTSLYEIFQRAQAGFLTGCFTTTANEQSNYQAAIDRRALE